jgi:hypothetical protein
MIYKNIRKISQKLFSIGAYLFLPIISFASTATIASAATCNVSQLKTLKDVIVNLVVGCVLYNLMYLMISASVVVFVWGVVKFIRSEGDDKQSGREFMFWGLVGLFVMVTVWGLVSVLQGTLNITGTYNITPKTVDLSF